MNDKLFAMTANLMSDPFEPETISAVIELHKV